MKILAVFFLVGTLAQCGHPEIKTDSACSVLKDTLYADGKFTLSLNEINNLSEANAIKVTAVKIFYRQKCLGKP